MTRVGWSGAGVVAALVVLVLATPLAAQERIVRYDGEVAVQADGSVEVTERITVVAEGDQIRRGIYRDFPTDYRDRYGNRVVVDLEVLGVERDGVPEPWFTERVSNGVRINTGDDSLLPVPGRFTFAIRYRTTRQLGFFAGHDELYWNAIGTGWVFPIESGSVEVRLPGPVAAESMSVEGYTGVQGAQGQDYTARVTGPGAARFELTRPLEAREGLTIVVAFPKGLVPEPTRAQRAGWFVRDNRGAGVALLGLLLVIGFGVVRWRQVGRGPPRGVVIPRYEPPAGRSPAALRFMRRMGYDDRCFTSDLLHLAVAGQLRIRQDSPPARTGLARLFAAAKGDEWSLERADADRATGSGLPPAVLTGLFTGGQSRLVLHHTNHEVLQAARTAHRKWLERDLQGRYFRLNRGSATAMFLLTIAAAGLAVGLAGGRGLPVIIVATALMVIVSAAFTRLFKAPTGEGRALLDEIEGLELYLTVAERDELAGMAGPGDAPPVDAERYEALLPYAVALDVEDAWTGRFTAAVGAAAAAEATSRMTWYAGTRPVTDLGEFSRSVGSSLSTQIASASSPPGSSSGSGGGGSSGGGGGGGGGGGR
jgi:uncharacterized membrane protein YgcG